MMKQINCSVNVNDYKAYQLFYPQTLSKFVRNAINLALNNRSFWEQVYFHSSEVKR